MLTRCFTVFLILLCLAGCVSHTPQNVPPRIMTAVQNRPSLPFNKVALKGSINVSLHTGYRKSAIILRGDSRDIANLKTVMEKGVLFIGFARNYRQNGAVSVEIRTNHLNGFRYEGMGTIVGKNIHSGLLNLYIDNPGQTSLAGSLVLHKLIAKGGGIIRIRDVRTQDFKLSIANKTKVQLAGVMMINNLDLEGEGYLSMYWVKSRMLTICARGGAYLQLAGLVDKLDVELWDNAHYNGRYLRAKNAFVKTHNHAIADLSAVKHQHTLAKDASDIYFYKIPDTSADFMAHQGSVLDMRDWDRNDLRDYDRYNSRSSRQSNKILKGLLSLFK